MSTTLPETVTTTNTTTTASTTNIGTTSTTAHPNPAAALDPLTTSSASSSTSSINTQEMLEKAKAAAISAGAAISSAAQQAGAAISHTAQSIDAKYHVSDKVSDATAHVTAALKHGHPAHAAKHAGTAAAIGDAERAKHEAGPLPDDAHAAGGGLTSSTVHTSSSLGSSESTTDKISNSAADVASHVSAAVNAGNPLHAAKYAGTAAMIGQVEREKHAHGPLEDEASIKAVDASTEQSTTASKGI